LGPASGVGGQEAEGSSDSLTISHMFDERLTAAVGGLSFYADHVAARLVPIGTSLRSPRRTI